MNSTLIPPLLQICGLGSLPMIVPLTKARTTIGRSSPPANDIALQPDPHRYVTREIHCFLDYQKSRGWYIVANGMNPTFLLRQGASLRSIQGRALLADGDKICIQGGLSETGDPLFWELLFRDPEGTQPTPADLSSAHLEYEEDQGRLFKVKGEARERINLRPQEDKLIRLMLTRNKSNNGIPVLIPISDLKVAVWDEDATTHGSDELHKLMFSLRQKLDATSKVSFLVNEPKRGYLLDTHPLLWENQRE